MYLAWINTNNLLHLQAYWHPVNPNTEPNIVDLYSIEQALPSALCALYVVSAVIGGQTLPLVGLYATNPYAGRVLVPGSKTSVGF
jgi:hypothetical protein